MNRKGNLHHVIDKILLNKVIFNYFRYFKKIFKREIFEFELTKNFHNFILRYIKKVETTIIKKKNLNVLMEFNNLKFIARDYRIYYDLMRFGKFEPTSTYIFESLLKEGMTVLDIGANIGYFSLIASKLVGNSGKVYSFEPDPITFKYLKKNITMNQISNVKLVNKCVSDEAGQLLLYHHPKYHTCHSIFGSPSKEAIKVESITLNNMFKKNNSLINFIKLDVEGAEMNVLRGMDEIFKKNNVYYLLIEINLRLIKEFEKEVKNLIFLLDRFFNKYFLIIDEKDSNMIFFNNKNSLIKFLESISQNNLNLLCIK